MLYASIIQGTFVPTLLTTILIFYFPVNSRGSGRDRDRKDDDRRDDRGGDRRGGRTFSRDDKKYESSLL